MQKIHGGLTATLDAPFDAVVAATRSALKEEGFGVLTEIDARATLREKLGIEMEPHLILGACNPSLAHAALQADVDISLLLPCNVTVRHENGRVVVSIVDPGMMAAMSSAPDLKEVAMTARAKLQRVIEALATASAGMKERNMKARDIMGRPVVAAARTTTARDVAIQMLMGGFSGMPITERDGVIVGIVTEFDIIHAIREGKPVETTTAEAIMTTEVASVDINDPVEKVIDILDTRHVLRVPVTERGKLVGVISRPDILRAFIEPNFMTFD